MASFPDPYFWLHSSIVGFDVRPAYALGVAVPFLKSTPQNAMYSCSVLSYPTLGEELYFVGTHFIRSFCQNKLVNGAMKS